MYVPFAFFLCFALFVKPSSLVAETASNRPVVILQTDAGENNGVGERLGFRVREGVQASSGIVLASEGGDGDLFVLLEMFNPDKGSSNRTVYSMAIGRKAPFLSEYFSWGHFVGTCASDRVAECAETLIAHVNRLAHQVREKREADLAEVVRAIERFKGGPVSPPDR